MLIKNKITTTEEKTVTVDCICNMCGNSLYRGVSNHTYGIEEITYNGGYESGPIIKDEEYYNFSLCENCLGDIIKQCKIPVVKQYISFYMQSNTNDSNDLDKKLYKISTATNKETLTEYLLDTNPTAREYALLKAKQLEK